ncbi:MAG: phosphotransferase [Alphaproteobacteria bacterium]|nr:phosphotransferase [Alphaproteobacteria bacterium]
MTLRHLALAELLKQADFDDADALPLAGDASMRTYCRYRRHDGASLILMDHPPEFGSVIHFMRMAERLAVAGASVPQIIAAAPAQGYLLLEDFGDETLSRALAAHPESECDYYQTAITILCALQKSHAAALIADLPFYTDWVEGDFTYYQRELSLFPEWYIPAVTGGKMPVMGQAPSPLTQQFLDDIWPVFLQELAHLPPQLVLRDYHVDNLMVLPNRTGIKSLGLLDFQDALAGPGVYDVVSLLRDARRDVTKDVVTHCARHYCAAMHYPQTQFARDFALLSLQRNFKILGLFVRLAWRDGKPQYLTHLPRIWRMIVEDSQALCEAWPGNEAQILDAWLHKNCPPAYRNFPLNPDFFTAQHS